MAVHSHGIMRFAAVAALMLVFMSASAQEFWVKGDSTQYVQAIEVLTPRLRSDVRGRVTVRFRAPGMDRAAARSAAYDRSGQSRHISLTPKPITLKADGSGEFTFKSSDMPYGPFTVQIYAVNAAGKRDLFELQLYNKGRSKVKAPVGIPDTIPAPARGMRLAYSDDFDGPLSISRDGRGARYNAHKPRFGDFSGWPFSDPEGEANPFGQRDSYLIIRARKPEGSRGSTGLIASVDMDGKGFRAKAPFYMECRFIAHSAPGTWPAFWTITNINRGPGDELDTVEAYGCWGAGNPNDTGYWVTSHFWGQKKPDGSPMEHPGRHILIDNTAGNTSWSEAFHTYGLYVDEQDTIYYFDDKEVWRHPTNPVSFSDPHVFLINYAIGGGSGWSIDLKRYGNASDMFVDYVRIFTKE